MEPLSAASLVALATLSLAPCFRASLAPGTADLPPLATELAWPEEVPALTPERGERQRLWSLTALMGQHDEKRFVEILTLRGGELESSYIAGLALNRRVLEWPQDLLWELEGSGFAHWGIQDHFEVNTAAVWRWTRFPWDERLDTSAAFGQGVSWASERPQFEDETRKFLHHLLAEVEVTPRRRTPLSLVLRVHHRSGVFGLYGASGGSNFLTLGLRYRF